MSTGSRKPAAGFTTGGFFLIALLLLSGCVHTYRQQLERLLAANLPSKQEITRTPFFPQERYQCGPAALATSLKYTGVDTSAQQLVPQVYVPAREGSLQTEMLAATRRHDRVAYVITPTLEVLLREVSSGTPVLVLQNLGLNWYPKWHYAVVVGYDLVEQNVVLRSGTMERRVIPISLFDRTWRRSNRWAIVVVRPGAVPVTAKETDYLKTILPFEQQGRWQIANTAYRAALARWPHSLGATMGAGNTYYQLGKKSDAERAYRAALTIDTNHAPAQNNLAQVLLEKNKLKEARAHAQQAVALGGPMRSSYEKTLMEIELIMKQR